MSTRTDALAEDDDEDEPRGLYRLAVTYGSSKTRGSQAVWPAGSVSLRPFSTIRASLPRSRTWLSGSDGLLREPGPLAAEFSRPDVRAQLVSRAGLFLLTPGLSHAWLAEELVEDLRREVRAETAATAHDRARKALYQDLLDEQSSGYRPDRASRAALPDAGRRNLREALSRFRHQIVAKVHTYEAWLTAYAIDGPPGAPGPGARSDGIAMARGAGGLYYHVRVKQPPEAVAAAARRLSAPAPVGVAAIPGVIDLGDGDGVLAGQVEDPSPLAPRRAQRDRDKLEARRREVYRMLGLARRRFCRDAPAA